jgi:hypothetical protein
MMMQQRMDCTHGLSVSKIPNTPKSKHTVRVLIIPTGMGPVNVDHFMTMKGKNLDVVIVEGIDRMYADSDESVNSLLRAMDPIAPDVIVAGSRGTELVTRLMNEYHGLIKCRILLFGPIKLNALFHSNKEYKSNFVIVHGKEDKNEKIEKVRCLVADRSNHVTLIEARKGHNMSFKHRQTVRNILKYTIHH